MQSFQGLLKNLFFSIPLVFISGFCAAQSQITLSAYIENYKGIAMEEMRSHGIPASIKLAQGILESGFGNSDLARIANNHFGIKCHGWSGRTFFKDDDTAHECFRAYDDPFQSYRDHSEFLKGRSHYASLFELDIMDYRAWARGLRQAGYATNPRYPDLLIGLIERNNLQQYDQLALVQLSNSRPVTPVAGASGSVISPTPQRVAEEFPPVGVGREIHENNSIRFIYARQGDSPESIAEEMGMWPREIYRYNDIETRGSIKPGQIVYLQPKRRRGSEPYHFVKSGETMHEISQKYGIRLQSLYRRNAMEEGSEPQTGQRLLLRGRVKK